MLVLLLALAIGSEPVDLVEKLGDKNYRTREKAQREIEKGINLKRYFGLKSRFYQEANPEIRKRIGNIIQNYENKLYLELNYKVNLGDYPQYPFIDSMPDGYRWESFNRGEIEKYYLSRAHSLGAPQDGKPKWTDYRKATELWMNYRIERKFRENIRSARSKEDFYDKMKKAMQTIQQDVEMMIEGDDKYWGKLNEPNPMRIGEKIFKE